MSAAKLKWTRGKITDGSSYTASALVEVDDAILVVEFECFKIEETDWLLAVTIDGERAVDEAYSKLSEAKQDAAESALRGFKRFCGGYCLR
tara:strand:+ start:1138 stop:1410 length:273 start_codon:yes stop_codon:yes gene_type:complete